MLCMNSYEKGYIVLAAGSRRLLAADLQTLLAYPDACAHGTTNPRAVDGRTPPSVRWAPASVQSPRGQP